MKKVISLSAVIMLSYVAFAQDSIPKSNANPNNNLDTMSKPLSHPKDTSTKNWNNQHPDSTGTSTGSNTMSSGTGSNNTMSSDSTNANGNASTNGSNSTMSNDSSSMSSNTNHSNMDSMSKASGSQSNSANSSTTTTTNTTNAAIITADSIKAYEKTLSDRVMMKDDKMYMLKDGEATPLEKSYKLSSGAVVSTLGTVKYPGGRVITLKNGQFIEIKPATTQTEKTKKSTKAVVTKKRVKTQSK